MLTYITQLQECSMKLLCNFINIIKSLGGYDMKNKEKFMELKKNLTAGIQSSCKKGTCCSYVIKYGDAK